MHCVFGAVQFNTRRIDFLAKFDLHYCPNARWASKTAWGTPRESHTESVNTVLHRPDGQLAWEYAILKCPSKSSVPRRLNRHLRPEAIRLGS